MRMLRSARELLKYLMFGSCLLLISFMFVFQELPSWRFYRTTAEREQSSTTVHRNNKTNDVNNIINNIEYLFTKNIIYLKNETSNENVEMLQNYTNDSLIERSTLLHRHSVGLKNIDYKEVLTRPNGVKDVNENDGRQPRQNQEAVKMLSDILNKKLHSVNFTGKIDQLKPTCENDFKLANSCDDRKCLQIELPKDLTTRVEQLVTNPKLQMSHDDHVILNEMAESVSGNYDIILLTAASSNHFLESQALLKNLHENVYPYLKNFTLIFYNLGLTEPERKLMVKYCKCQVKDFPFNKFPQFMMLLKCYSWKPVLVKAHLQKANIVFWIDASIRFHNSSVNLNNLIQTARERGVLIRRSSADSTFKTDRSMYHFFGDEPCAYLSLTQAESGFGVYHREYFVDRAILEPWVACALNNDCMCLKLQVNVDCKSSNDASEMYYRSKGPIVYGLCHRFDQSAISLILHKLYQEVNRWVMVGTGSLMKVRRENKLFYFPEQI